MRKWLMSVAWVLLGLLAVSAFVISAGNKSGRVEPSASSYSPSGVSALADLFRLRGYQVVIDSHPHPKLAKGDVAVAFQLTKQAVGSSPSEIADAKAIQDADDAILSQIKGGGTVFWLPIDQSFEEASAKAKSPDAYKRIDGQTRALSGSGGPLLDSGTDSDSSVALVYDKQNAFVTGDRIGDGYAITYSDAIGLTNRFLDKANNAQTFMELVKSYAPQARRVVFTQATFGKANAVGFLETLGPWAEGSWYQFLFLIGVIVFTWNQRFGLPIRVRKRQSGGRELVDALSDTMLRARATDMGLESAYNRADARVRKVIKLPRDASEGERDRTLPENVLQRLAEVKAASAMKKVRPEDALTLVIKLEKTVDDFAAEHGSMPVKPRRRKKSA